MEAFHVHIDIWSEFWADFLAWWMEEGDENPFLPAMEPWIFTSFTNSVQAVRANKAAMNSIWRILVQ